ncbi:hypothetical protein D3C72_1992430 [compost metagenome]
MVLPLLVEVVGERIAVAAVEPVLASCSALLVVPFGVSLPELGAQSHAQRSEVPDV